MEKLLIINSGSASKKYALYQAGARVLSVHFEKEAGDLIATLTAGADQEVRKVSQEQYENALGFTLEAVRAKDLIGDFKEISAVGLRVVAPGAHFQKNHRLDQECLVHLEEAKLEAPLHIKPVLAEISQLEKILPEVPVILVSDSAFYTSLPEVSRRYSLPAELAEKYGIYRYGYHGISMSSVLKELEGQITARPERIVICHLGSGSTVTAVKDSQAFDTSMGFTPLEGLIMGTRIGTIDAGAVLYLAQREKLGLSELEEFFNEKCGLLGLSGKTNDVRELIELEKQGDAGAKLALDAFAIQVKKYIGAYAAEMGGLDLLVFTATIGERSFIMRERILTGLEHLGIQLDHAKNEQTVSKHVFIDQDGSRVRIAVTPTNEMGQIASETSLVLKS